MVAQPLAALGQGLGVGEHLTDALDWAAAHQGMANRQHKGPGHPQLRVLPEGIQAGRHPTLHGVFHRHHGGVTAALGQGLDHGADAHLGEQLGLGPTLQGRQPHGGLLPVGTGRSEEGKTHGRKRGLSSIGSCRAGPQ